MIQRALALLAIVVLAGCGGGSTPAGTNPTPGGAQNHGPVATATLKLVYSSAFHAAKVPSSGPRGVSRRPAYVNSTPQFLDVWVVSNGSAVHVVNSSGGSNVAATPSGSQTFSIPLYSTASSQIVAFEADQPDGTPGNLLAAGEADLAGITAGTAPQVALTMLMNAAHIGVMSDPNDANGDATTGSPYTTFNQVCSTPQNSGPLYFFATDADGGFIDTAGAGGVAVPLVSSWTPDGALPADTLSKANGVAGSASLTYNTLSLGLTVKLAATNLVNAIATDALNDTGAYPGADFLYRSGLDPVFANELAGQAGSPTIAASIDILPNFASCSIGFGFSGGQQNFVVPFGINQVSVVAAGAQGSGGGLGGSATASVPVVPGETLAVYVGGDPGGAGGGFNGGGASGGFGCNSGGGGGSDVREGGVALANRIIVAGAGGGGGCDNGQGGGGGGAGGLNGGAGGGVGSAGGGGGSGGGTGVAGGAGGAGGAGQGGPNGAAGGNGALGAAGGGGAGAAGACSGLGGSGGGGGYYGGGGGGGGGYNGACTGGYGGGGGAGGSSFAEGTASGVSFAAGVQFGNGQVTISY